MRHLKIKTSSLLLVLILSIQCYGQRLSDIMPCIKARDFKKMKVYLDSTYSDEMFSWKTSRDIMEGYKETFFEHGAYAFIKNDTGVNKSYRLELLSAGDDIFHYVIREKIYTNNKGKDWAESFRLLDSFTAADKFAAFEKAFGETYGIHLLKSDLFKSVKYGSVCGIAGGPTEHQMKLDTFLLENDIASIMRWLQSANTEKQLYAMYGFKVLSHYGYSQTPKENDLIALVRKKEGVVHTCGGCSSKLDSIKVSVAEIDNWDGEYDIFEQKKERINNIIYYSLYSLFLICCVWYIYKGKPQKDKTLI